MEWLRWLTGTGGSAAASNGNHSAEHDGDDDALYFRGTADSACTFSPGPVHDVLLAQDLALNATQLVAGKLRAVSGAWEGPAALQVAVGRAAVYLHAGARVHCYLPYPALSHYGVVERAVQHGRARALLVHLRDDLPPLYLLATDAAAAADRVPDIVGVLLDAALLRWARKLWALDAEPGARHDRLRVEPPLELEPRAARRPDAFSAHALYVGGTRMLGALALPHLGTACPCVVCVTPGGVLLLLPAQRQMQPLFWGELGAVTVVDAATVELEWSYYYADAASTTRVRLTDLRGGAAALEDLLLTCRDVHYLHASAAALPRFPRRYPPLRYDGLPLLAPPLAPEPRAAVDAALLAALRAPASAGVGPAVAPEPAPEARPTVVAPPEARRVPQSALRLAPRAPADALEDEPEEHLSGQGYWSYFAHEQSE